MKFDKETIIVLAVAVALLIGWTMFYKPENKPAPQPQTVQTAAQTQSAPTQTVPAVPVSQAVQTVQTVQKPADAVPAVLPKAVPVVLENDLVRMTLDPGSGTLEQVELKKYKKSIGSEENLVFASADGELNTFETNLGMPLKLPEVVQDKNSVRITRDFPGFRVIQVFTLKEKSYELDMTYTLVNTGAATILPELVIWTAGMPPMQALSGDKVNSIRHNVDYCLVAKQKVKSFSPDADDPEEIADEETREPVCWLGSTNKYFASLLFIRDGAEFNNGLKLKQTSFVASGTKFARPFVGGSIKNIQLPAGASKTWNFQYYCGPKELKEIKALPESAMEAMHIAYWSWFEFIARPLARFLTMLYDLTGNYGIAIILLTLIVRLIFWPVTQKANNSMRKMQKIQPKMKALREKYKNNPQELNMRMMELYKQEKVNPLGGCLPMLLQLPIFFALYSVFDSAVELRHVSFLWAKDLAQPDQVGPVLNFLGFDLALHPWIIMMTILMVVQQKMTPAQGDPAQQKIMMAMPVIMLVMLYWLPSGLTLYWTVSQLFSIIQLKYGQYIAAKEEAQANASGTAVKK